MGAEGAITWLAPIEAEGDGRDGGSGADHPMRVVTREALDGTTGWSDERRSDVNALFDRLADEWHTRDGPGRHLPVLDALDRGEVGNGRCLELGSGTGLVTSRLVPRFGSLIAADLSMEMLRRAPGVAPRLRADATALPLPDRSIDVLLLMNMLLFPTEADRVLAVDGAVVWVNSRGAGTPIHLPAEDVVDALPGSWSAVASSHGESTWCVARRAV
ncbi:MAG: class I SAM-dependent methyltransferase [Actinomycetota bacterium]